jgi:alkylhydroperoxidase family enzyme
VGRSQGIETEKLREVSAWKTSTRFDEMERLVLGYADAMTQAPVDVPDRLFEALRARLRPDQLVELTTALAWENFRARWNRALLIGSDSVAGDACLLPERA